MSQQISVSVYTSYLTRMIWLIMQKALRTYQDKKVDFYYSYNLYYFFPVIWVDFDNYMSKTIILFEEIHN